MDRIGSAVPADQGPVRLSPEAAARLDALFRAHNGFVLELAVAQLHDPDRAQDLAQSAWLSVIPLLARGESIDNARSFLAVVVRRRAIDFGRRKVTRLERPADWSDAVTVRALPPAPPADADALCLADLSARQAAVVKLAAQGFSNRAIAARIGRSETAVRKRLHRGARALRLASAGAR
jgi:RNA polymerase sigma factor (sigma-70 family)